MLATMRDTSVLHPVTVQRMGDWGRHWARAGDAAIRRADAELDSGLLAAACESYLAAARYYWLALPGLALHSADRRALEDAHAAAFRAAVPMLPHPATSFEIAVGDVVVAGYLFLPAGARTASSVVLRTVRPPSTAESGYWLVAPPVLDSGAACAVIAAAPSHLASAASAVTRWIAHHAGAGEVIDTTLETDGADVPPPHRRSRS